MSYYDYWGKAGKDDDFDKFHLLPYHCLDVASAGFNVMENHTLIPDICEKINLSEYSFKRLMLFYLALHDIGKFDLRFQNLRSDLLHILQNKKIIGEYTTRHDQMGFDMFNKYLTSHILDNLMSLTKENEILDSRIEDILHIFANISAGHHGKPLLFETDDKSYQMIHDKDDVISFTNDIFSLFIDDTTINELKYLDDGSISNIIEVLQKYSWELSGLIVFSDWIASGDNGYKYEISEVNVQKYFKLSGNITKMAIQESAVYPKKTSSITGMRHLFSEFANKMTGLQSHCNTAVIEKSPQLWILEDATGSGKTEASIVLASSIIKKNNLLGCFIALPTMATSNSMYDRIGNVYEKMFDPGESPTLVLSHGNKKLSKSFRSSIKTNIWDTKIDDFYNMGNIDEGGASCSKWLSDSSKKSLLGDIGVGTIDQILMSSIAVKYQTFRMFGLYKKLLIVDEVHSYNPYMTKLLEDLIVKHVSYGGSMILLSATLSKETRQRLLSAYNRGMGISDTVELKETGYPLVTSATEKGIIETQIPISNLSKEKEVRIVSGVSKSKDIVRKAVSEGKSVCWIRNNVADAVSTFQSLSRDIKDIDIFHSNYVLEDRLDIENRVVKKYGKNGTSNNGSVLIATQVVEQSLDLDFDLMITDICPIDLVIQRAGRLHRHDKEGRHFKPIIYVNSPLCFDKITSTWFSDFSHINALIYSDHSIIWKTLQILKKHKTIDVYKNSRSLIEGVYGDNAIPFPGVFEDSNNGSITRDSVSEAMAGLNTINTLPGYCDESNSIWSSDERARTRIIEPTTTVYLVDIIDGVITPIHNGERYSWDYSSISVPSRRVGEIIYGDSTVKSLVDKLIASEQHEWRFKYGALLLVRSDQGVEGVNGRDKRIRIFYNSDVGLEIIRED